MVHDYARIGSGIKDLRQYVKRLNRFKFVKVQGKYYTIIDNLPYSSKLTMESEEWFGWRTVKKSLGYLN